MGAYNNLSKSYTLLNNNSKNVQLLIKCLVRYCGYQSLATNADTMDNFTTQLMQKKTTKWDNVRTKINTKQDLRLRDAQLKDVEHNTNITLSKTELNDTLWDAIESSNCLNVRKLTDVFLSQRQLPSILVLDKTLSYYANMGDKDTVSNIISLCTELNLDALKENSYFKHYLAESVWIKGNIDQSLCMFNEVYRSNNYLRRKIKCMLKYLIVDTITHRSEAALLIVIKFAKSLVKDFTDFYILACIWEICFLSEWFTDQCIALDLLQQNEGLLEAISNRLPFIIALALKSDQTEIVYRLLEVLLKNGEKLHSARILEVLFDYRVRRGDLSGCTDIVKWSLQHKIELSVIQKDEFLYLLLGYKQPPMIDRKIKPKTETQCNYKF